MLDTPDWKCVIGIHLLSLWVAAWLAFTWTIYDWMMLKWTIHTLFIQNDRPAKLYAIRTANTLKQFDVHSKHVTQTPTAGASASIFFFFRLQQSFNGDTAD